jgi:hypothetical protein
MKMILITCFFTFLQALDQKSVFPPRCFCRPPPVLTPPGENFIHIPVIPPGCEPKTTPPGCKTLTPSGGTPPPPRVEKTPCTCMAYEKGNTSRAEYKHSPCLQKPLLPLANPSSLPRLLPPISSWMYLGRSCLHVAKYECSAPLRLVDDDEGQGDGGSGGRGRKK